MGELKTSDLFIEASTAGGAIDATASTETLLRLGEMVPDEWLDASAHGRPDAAKTIVRELELGCHSVILHGAEPHEIAPMVSAYRDVRPSSSGRRHQPGPVRLISLVGRETQSVDGVRREANGNLDPALRRRRSESPPPQVSAGLSPSENRPAATAAITDPVVTRPWLDRYARRARSRRSAPVAPSVARTTRPRSRSGNAAR